MRRQHYFAGVLHSETLANVFKTSTHRQRGRGQHGALQLIEQAGLQDGCDIDWGSLEEHVLLFAMQAASATTLDPEHGVAVLRLHEEVQLNPQLVATAQEGEDFFWFLRQFMQFSA